ncbi:MAG: hypothetical protein U5K81_08315 [Trueperaceae bacterium]|nr:hypothetical protein [Trueperaceae bacterium]
MIPRDPAATPDASAAARARTSVRLHLGAALWYALLIGAIGVTAWRTSSSLATVGLALAAALIASAVWEATRVLTTLDLPYAAMREAWLERTSLLAGVKHISVFASILVMVGVVRLPGRRVVWPRRVLVSAVRITGAVAGVLGIVGLSLGPPQAVGAGSGFLLLAAIGLAGLLASGYFGRPEQESS